MQVSTTAREVSDVMAFQLINEEVKLFAKIEHLMKLKGKIGEKLMAFGANEANVKKYLAQAELLDKEIKPLSDQHQKILDLLKTKFGIIVSHN
jgi:hypothetical protein